MSEEVRRVERQQADGTWQACQLVDIRAGDVFRMWEPPDWNPVVVEYFVTMGSSQSRREITLFRAKSDAYEGTLNGDADGGRRTIVDVRPARKQWWPRGSHVTSERMVSDGPQ